VEQTNVISKLNHLESLVQTLMSERSSQTSTQRTDDQIEVYTQSACPSVDALPNSFGRLSLDRTEPNYVGSDHWAAIIDGVSFSRASDKFQPLAAST
jgi:hypothetical protein